MNTLPTIEDLEKAAADVEANVNRSEVELGHLLIGDLDLLREYLYRQANPCDPATRAAWDRFFQGYRVPDSKDAKKVEV